MMQNIHVELCKANGLFECIELSAYCETPEQIPKNRAAIDFWAQVVTDYTKGQFETPSKMIPEPEPHPMIVLKFVSLGEEK